MRKSLYAITLLTLAACTRIANPALESTPDSVVNEESAFVSGTVSVKVSDEMAEVLESSESLPAVLAVAGISEAERVFPDAGEWEARHRKAGLHKWYRMRYDESAPMTKAISDLSDIPGIENVEPVRKQRLTAYFNDPMLPDQWALYNDGSMGTKYAAGCDVNVIPVWERYTTGSKDVIVAVLDQGVQLDHPDLADITIPSGPDGSKCFVSGHTGYNIKAGDHGTHCAGIIAAVNNNGKGICGIAGGNDGKGGVRILSCEMLRVDPSDPSKSLNGSSENAMVWAADKGAVISSNSWGYVYSSETDAANGSVGMMAESIDYFIKYAGCDAEGNQRPDSPMKGGVVIFAAGNEGWQHAWPAKYDKVIAVGAVSSKRTKAYYTNFGPWVDICAPGGDAQLGPQILSSISNNRYSQMQGTSMACPHVSGVAALIVSYFGGQGFTNEMLVERLLKGASAEKAPGYSNIGPMVDALGSFSLGGTVAPDPVDKILRGDVVSNNVSLTWKVTADADDFKAYSYRAFAAKDKGLLEGLKPGNIPTSVVSQVVEVNRKAVGDEISAVFSGLDFETEYYFVVVAQDYAGNVSEMSEISSFKTLKNNAPVISSNQSTDIRLQSFETITFEVSAYDPDGHDFEITVDAGSEAFTYEKTENGLNITIDALKADAGKYTATLTATDAFGLASELKFNYEILPNHAPKISKEIENMLLTAVGESRDLAISDFITDEDGETPTYTVSYSTPNVVHLNPTEGSFKITALAYGLTEVYIKAEDARKESCTATFKVLVQDNSRPVDLYPNPVSTVLNIRPLSSGQMSVVISNKAGAVIYNSESEVTPFDPLVIDLKGKSAGTYYVKIKSAEIDSVYTIAKL
ncbi:MAG: S8 family serine peptidase [Bacteroidales bacterium]|nr:S8 family serine peptidase [Bacteroidales bacterium]